MLIFYEGSSIPDKASELFNLNRIDVSERIPKINILDPFYTYGSDIIARTLYNDDMGEFDTWYNEFIISNPTAMKVICDLVISLMNFEYTIVYVNTHEYGILIAEAIMEFLSANYGIHSLHLSWDADLNEELMNIDDSEQNFTDFGSDRVKALLNAYGNGMVRVSEDELEFIGDDIDDI